jgi:hypothetical protein
MPKTKNPLAVAVVFTDKMNEAVTIGKAMTQTGQLFAEKFRTFVSYCRDNLEPKQITEVLKAIELPDSRCSEIKAICSLPPSNFQQYEKGEIGFRPALEKARELRNTKRGSKSKRDFFIPLMKKASVYTQHLKVGADKFKGHGAAINNGFAVIVVPLNERFDALIELPGHAYKVAVAIRAETK